MLLSIVWFIVANLRVNVGAATDETNKVEAEYTVSSYAFAYALVSSAAK